MNIVVASTITITIIIFFTLGTPFPREPKNWLRLILLLLLLLLLLLCIKILNGIDVFFSSYSLMHVNGWHVNLTALVSHWAQQEKQ